MAVLPLRVWWFAGVLLLWSAWAPQPATADKCEKLEVLVRVVMAKIDLTMQQSAKKLLEHDVSSSHHWGELKRLVTALDRNNSDLVPVKDLVTRMDERLNNLENRLSHEKESESKMQMETREAFVILNASVQKLTSTVESLVNKDSNEANNTKDYFLERRLNMTDSKIDDVKSQIKNLSNCNEESLRSVCQKMIDTNPLDRNHTAKAEELLKKYELKLVEYSGSFPNISDFALTNDIVGEMKRQGVEIRRMQHFLHEAGIMWGKLPKLSHFKDLQVGMNQTLDAVIIATESLNYNSEATMVNLTREVRQLSAQLLATNESIQGSVTQSSLLADSVFDDISNGLLALRAQIQSLTKNEILIRETADNVKTTKKNVEYAANRVLAQVSTFVSQLGTSLNDSLDQKLKKIETSIMSNQTASNSELNFKIGEEMLHLWREIGIMHDQLKASHGTVTALSEHTNNYVDSSTKTMIGLKDDVSLISRRTLALSNNLNEALVRLKQATDEFGRMTAGLETP